jgi:AraC-like DNA-binding protein
MPQAFIRNVYEPDGVGCPVPGTAVSVTLTSAVRYAGTGTALQLDNLWLMSGLDNAAKTMRIHLPDEYVVFSMQPGLQQRTCSGGVEFRRNHMNLHSPGRDYIYTTDGPSMASSVFVPVDLLEQMAETYGIVPPDPDESCMFAPPPQALQRLVRLHLGATRMAREAPGTAARAEAMQCLEDALFEALAACLRPGETQLPSLALRNQAAIVNRFTDILMRAPHQNLFMADICKQIGCSARTLRACCDEQLGMGPKHFLMLRRLHLVRRKLLDGNAETMSVTDVATEFGFWELGRFSVAYRRLFGESPSFTLRQSPDFRGPETFWPYGETGTPDTWYGDSWAAAMAWVQNAGLRTAGQSAAQSAAQGAAWN